MFETLGVFLMALVLSTHHSHTCALDIPNFKERSYAWSTGQGWLSSQSRYFLLQGFCLFSRSEGRRQREGKIKREKKEKKKEKKKNLKITQHNKVLTQWRNTLYYFLSIQWMNTMDIVREEWKKELSLTTQSTKKRRRNRRKEILFSI